MSPPLQPDWPDDDAGIPRVTILSVSATRAEKLLELGETEIFQE
jgi:hypothetical protein